MKTKFFCLACILLMQVAARAQMKIGDNSTSINSNSLLELESLNKGFVLPRISLTNVNSSFPLTSSLLTSTMIYNTNSSTTGGSGTGIYYWDGSKWNFVTNSATTGANYWALTGNSGLNASTNFIGTTDAVDFVAKTNNLERMRILGAASLTGKPGWIGMGITIPRSSLDVTGDYTNKNVLTIQNTSSTGFSSVDMLDNTGALKGTFGYANSGTGGNFASRDYFNSYGSDLLFTANSGSYHLFLKGGTGNIGINTNTPSERLHVVGNFYLNGAFMPGGNAGTSGYVLTSSGAGVSPTWTNPANFAWSLTGNASTNYATNFLGTTDNVSLRMRTNNTERMVIDSIGNVYIGGNYNIPSFNPGNPPIFSVDYGTTTSNTLAYLRGSVDSYFQINLRNKSNSPYASTDYVATADDGTDSTYYIDMGINSSTYAPSVENWGGPHDAYLYASSRNLVIGTATGGSDVIFLVGGGKVKPNAIMRLNASDGHVIIGKGEATTSPNGTILRGPNAQTGSINIAGGSFTVSGGSSTGTATGGTLNITGGAATSSGTGGTLNLNGGTSSSGTGGVVLLNTSSTERMRIDALGNVGIANTIPSEKLDVTGNVRFSGALMPNNLAGTSGYLLSSSGAGTAPVWLNPASISSTYAWVLGGNTLSSQQNFGTLNNYPIPFYTNGAERMRITNTGLVGIGTTNPASDLTIFQSSGSGSSKGFTFTGNSIGGASSGTGFLMSLGYNATGNKQLWLGDADYAGNASGSFARLVVGGTSFPVLDAVSGNNVSRRYLALGVSGDANSGVIFGADNTNVNPGSQVWDNGNMAIGNGYKSYVAPSNGLLVQGNVGIGTASPTSALSVLAASNPLYLSGVQATGSFSTDSILTILNGVVKKAPYSSLPSGGSGWALTGNSGTIAGTNFLGTTDAIDFVTKTNNTERMRVTSSGSVGIGITNPQQSLSVGNGLNIDQNNANTGSTVSALTFGSGSGEGIGSKRNAGGNQYGLDFYTSFNNRMTITNAGLVGIGTTNPGYELSILAASNPLYLSGVQATGSFSTDSILTILNGVVKKAPYSSLPSGGSGWALTGNSGTIAGTNFLGTTDAQPLIIKSLNRQLAYFDGNLYSIALGYGAVNGSSDHNIAIGYNATTNNQYTLAIGYNATATGVRSIAIGNGSSAAIASGAESVAIGYNAISSADQTVSLGYQAKATGQYGVALGYTSQATASQSTAIGYAAFASAQYSNAIGYQAQTTGIQSTAIGYKAQTAQGNTILLGDVGTANLHVGIGTSTPSAKLDIVGASGNNPLEITGLPTGISGTDNFLTINSSGVVGYVSPVSVSGSYWSLTGNAAASGSFLGTTNTTALLFKYNNTSAGTIDANNNTAFGTGYSFSGSQNTAIGYSSNAANSATAVGANSDASQANNTAIGSNAKANISSQATAIGASSQALYQNSTAVGYNAQATVTNQETVIGASSQAQGQNNIAIGYSAKAINSDKITVVGSNAQGSFQNNTVVGYGALATVNNQATAIGAASDASAQNATALGYNASATGTNSTAIGYNATTSQNNALVLGTTATTNVGIGTSTPNTSTKLDVAGYVKLGSNGTVTKNIISLSSTISSTNISAQYTATTVAFTPNVVVQNTNTNYIDVTFTLPAAASNTTATVTVSPGFDLPDDIVIAFARLTSTTQGKIRFMNLGTTTRALAGTVYITVTDF